MEGRGSHHGHGTARKQRRRLASMNERGAMETNGVDVEGTALAIFGLDEEADTMGLALRT
uniref:Uncharacterized protein n=1 Tax=Oryza nivara TaxID=4536 RepID=A0A0E0IHP4_ORYNI